MMNSKLLKLCAVCGVIVTIAACSGKSQKSDVPSGQLNDSLPLNTDTVVAVNESAKIEIDTLAFPQFEFRIGSDKWPFTYADTTVNGRHVICGTAITHEEDEKVLLSYIEDRDVYEPGSVIYTMIDPVDSRDIIFFRREMFIDTLDLRSHPYMGERLSQLVLGKCIFKGVSGDTVVLNCLLGINNTDAVYDLDLKLLKENDSVSLRIIDNPIIWDDDEDEVIVSELLNKNIVSDFVSVSTISREE